MVKTQEGASLEGASRRSLSPSSPSASAAPSSYESKAEDGLTDAEVARLLRRHLNILVGSQEASDAEVVEAARSSSGEARPSEDASQQATSCWSGGFCVNASQVVDEGQDERENNTQESQPNGAAQDVTAAEALVGDESGTNRCGESRLTTRSSHDQPAKKFRAGLQNWR
ncbi:hypothetical protein ACSSS7_003789 [Eimeria intestinalis]